MAIQIPSLDSEPPPPTHKSGPDFSLTQTLSAHTRAVTALRFSNDGTVLVSAGASTEIAWDRDDDLMHLRRRWVSPLLVGLAVDNLSALLTQ